MKTKHPYLPRYIIKQQNGRYRDMKTLKWVSTSQLESYCPTTQENAEIKHEIIMSKRYDLNRD